MLKRLNHLTHRWIGIVPGVVVFGWSGARTPHHRRGGAEGSLGHRSSRWDAALARASDGGVARATLALGVPR
jgi:hypothetical protein